jgi:membrane protease YdiL (CAAX protease family)
MAVGAIITILASLVLSRYILEWLSNYDWPIPVYVAIAGLIGYGPVLAFCWLASYRVGSRSLRADTGLYIRKVDAGWGPVTWLGCIASQIVLGTLILVFRIPLTSNVEPIDGQGSATRGYIISLLILAVVAAPIIEEMVFRGVVMRGLRSRMGAPLAIGVQAVVFGLAHFDPVRGAGNIGLVLILSGAGAVLGFSAYRFRRIGPTMIAHAIINAIAMTIALTGLLES